jgi:hypothetical protein
MVLVHVSFFLIPVSRASKADLTLNGLNGVVYQKIELFVTTNVRTSNPT